MGMRRAQHVGVAFVRQPDVIDILTATAQKTGVLGTGHRLAYCELSHDPSQKYCFDPRSENLAYCRMRFHRAGA